MYVPQVSNNCKKKSSQGQIDFLNKIPGTFWQSSLLWKNKIIR